MHQHKLAKLNHNHHNLASLSHNHQFGESYCVTMFFGHLTLFFGAFCSLLCSLLCMNIGTPFFGDDCILLCMNIGTLYFCSQVMKIRNIHCISLIDTYYTCLHEHLLSLSLDKNHTIKTHTTTTIHHLKPLDFFLCYVFPSMMNRYRSSQIQKPQPSCCGHLRNLLPGF